MALGCRRGNGRRRPTPSRISGSSTASSARATVGTAFASPRRRLSMTSTGATVIFCAGTVQRQADGKPTLPVEPHRQRDGNRRGAGAGPTGRHQQRGNIQLPGRLPAGKQRGAAAQQYRTAAQNDFSAKTIKRGMHAGQQQGADQVESGHRGGDQRTRPAVRAAQLREIDRLAVEVQIPRRKPRLRSRQAPPANNAAARFPPEHQGRSVRARPRSCPFRPR